MTKTKVNSFWTKKFWVQETLSGGTEYRKRSIVLFTVLSIMLAALFYKLLIVIEGLENSRDILAILTYGLGVLLAVLILLMIIIWLLEYLHKFE